MTIEEVGKFLESMYSLRYLGVANILCLVPANVKGEDVFHLTVEEYLLALISVVEELVCFQLIYLIMAETLRSPVSRSTLLHSATIPVLCRLGISSRIFLPGFSC